MAWKVFPVSSCDDKEVEENQWGGGQAAVRRDAHPALGAAPEHVHTAAEPAAPGGTCCPGSHPDWVNRGLHLDKIPPADSSAQ